MAKPIELEPYKSKVVKCPKCLENNALTHRAKDCSIYILKCPNCGDVELLGDAYPCPNCGELVTLKQESPDSHVYVLSCDSCGEMSEIEGYKEETQRRLYRKEMNDAMRDKLRKTKPFC